VRALGAALAAAVVAACGTSAPPRYYTLDSTVAAGGAPAAGLAILVGPVTVPASVDRPEFVVQTAPNRVEIDEFNRWAAPLGESIGRTIAADLRTLLATPDVATAPFANFDASHRVTIRVERFDSIPGEAVVLDAVWAVRASAGGEPTSGRTLAREAVAGPGYEALAAAHSRALATLSGEIAAAIRSQAAVR
jgi:uncharacterized lipoprotein YmbA